MTDQENKTEITKLSIYDMADTVVKWEGYDQTEMPRTDSKKYEIIYG